MPRQVAPVDVEEEEAEVPTNSSKTPEQLQKVFLSCVRDVGNPTGDTPQQLLQDALCCCAIVDAADVAATLKRRERDLNLDEVSTSKTGAVTFCSAGQLLQPTKGYRALRDCSPAGSNTGICSL